MPLDEQFLKSDSKAYHISEILDNRVEEFYSQNAIIVKKEQKNLKEMLNLCMKINHLFSGFENPPHEITRDISDDAMKALNEYYLKFKNDMLHKTNLDIIFGYEIIRLAFNFWNEIPKYLFRIEEMQSSNSSLNDIEMVFNNLEEEKKKHRYTLLTSNNTTPLERMCLYEYFSNEVDNIVINRLVQIYSSKLNNKIFKDISEFCRVNSIAFKTSDLGKKILISNMLFQQFAKAKQMITSKFENYKDIGIEILNNELLRLENSYLTSALSIKELETIVNSVNSLLEKIKNETSKPKMSSYIDAAQNDYKGNMKTEVIEWLKSLNNDILTIGYTDKIATTYMLRIEDAN